MKPKTMKQKVAVDRARWKYWKKIKTMWTEVVIKDDKGRRFPVEFCDN